MFSYFYVNTNPSRSSSFSCQSFSTGVFLSKWIRSTSVRSTKVFLNVVCFIHLQVVFAFPTLSPFYFKESYFLINYPFYSCEVPSFFSINVLTRWFSWRCSTSSSFFVLFLLRWFQVKLCWSYPFLISMLSHAGAILNCSPLAILLFRSAQDISKIRVSTLHSFKLFRDWYLIQVI